jgi:hypothetical protein
VVNAFERRRMPIRQALRSIEARLHASSGIRRVAVCPAGRCRDVPLRTFVDGFGGTQVPLRGDDAGPDPVAISVIIDRVGQPLQLASGTVHPHRFEPNGPGCGTWWEGAGRVEGAAVRDVS